jgi:hypothetical protein
VMSCPSNFSSRVKSWTAQTVRKKLTNSAESFTSSGLGLDFALFSCVN